MTALIKGLPGNGAFGRYAPCGAITRRMLLHHSVGHDHRPCAVVLARQDEDGTTRVYVLPITHTAPTQPDDVVEIAGPVKARLGPDEERSWVEKGFYGSAN
jgi:hypothetical protein